MEASFQNYLMERACLIAFVHTVSDECPLFVTLEAHDFTWVIHRLVFQCMQEQWNSLQQKRQERLLKYLQDHYDLIAYTGDIAIYVERLFDEVRSTRSLEELAQGIHNLGVMRRLVKVVAESYSLLMNDNINGPSPI